jgi:hypothetical protein
MIRTGTSAHEATILIRTYAEIRHSCLSLQHFEARIEAHFNLLKNLIGSYMNC